MMPTDDDIARAAALGEQPITSLEGWERVDGDPQAARKVLSARVPDEVSQWIVEQAVAQQVSPSRLTAVLLQEAIDARRAAAAGLPVARRRLVDVDDVHRMLDGLASAA